MFKKVMHRSRDFFKMLLLFIIIYTLRMDVRRVCCKQAVNKDALVLARKVKVFLHKEVSV